MLSLFDNSLKFLFIHMRLVINSLEMNKYLKFLMRETVRILTRPSMKGLRKCPDDVVIYSVWNIPT